MKARRLPCYSNGGGQLKVIWSSFYGHKGHHFKGKRSVLYANQFDEAEGQTIHCFLACFNSPPFADFITVLTLRGLGGREDMFHLEVGRGRERDIMLFFLNHIYL